MNLIKLSMMGTAIVIASSPIVGASAKEDAAKQYISATLRNYDKFVRDYTIDLSANSLSVLADALSELDTLENDGTYELLTLLAAFEALKETPNENLPQDFRNYIEETKSIALLLDNMIDRFNQGDMSEQEMEEYSDSTFRILEENEIRMRKQYPRVANVLANTILAANLMILVEEDVNIVINPQIELTKKLGNYKESKLNILVMRLRLSSAYMKELKNLSF